MIIHNVEQRTDEWNQLRAGKVTASEASRLVTPTGKPSAQLADYAMQLAGDSYAENVLSTWEGNHHTDRGIELEDAAIDAYELFTGTWVKRVGFCTADDGDYGCSPDGLHDDGMIELKCLAAKNHVKAWLDREKAAQDYTPQVQMQLLVTKYEWCHLVFYHPSLPLLVIKQEPIPEFQKLLTEQIEKCLKLRDKAVDILRKE